MDRVWWNYVRRELLPFDKHPPLDELEDYLPQQHVVIALYRSYLKAGEKPLTAYERVVEILSRAAVQDLTQWARNLPAAKRLPPGPSSREWPRPCE